MPTPVPEAQTNAALPCVPHPELDKLSVMTDVQVPPGFANNCRPLTLSAGVNPRFTPEMISLAPAVTAPVIAIVSVADVELISNEYVAAGHPGLALPQSVRDSEPIWSAFAAP